MNTVEAKGGQQVCPMCGGGMTLRWTYDAAPEGEMHYAFLDTMSYYREYHQCGTCAHFLEWVPFSFDRLYSSDYVDSTYGDIGGIRAAFARIMALPPEKSDNFHRVRWIHEALARNGGTLSDGATSLALLDVGFGLGVFPAAMKLKGWHCHGIDLDNRQIEHARTDLGIEAYDRDLATISDIGPFDLITFNKVLEHVEKPEELLADAQRLLKPGGVVYVELPDGEFAASEGHAREEFFVEHIHVFSFASYALLARKAGFKVLECVSAREPSSKFTLRGLLRCLCT